jgi:tyrosine-protein kinase Etk/Wzc
MTSPASSPSPNGRRPTDDARRLSLEQVGVVLRRQVWWLLGTVVVVGGGAAVHTFRQQPIYESRATLRIEERPPGSAPDILTQLTWPQTLETEIELLRSRSVAEDVVRAQGLHVAVVDPPGAARDSMVQLEEGAAARPGSYALERHGDLAVLAGPSGAADTAPADSLLAVDGLRLRPRAGTPTAATLVVGDVGAAAERIRASLRVGRVQTGARIVHVTWRGTDPVVARDVANGIARAYLERRNQIQKQQARTAVGYLQDQVTTIGAQLAAAEQELEAYRRSQLLLDPDAQSSDQVRRLAQLRTQRDELEFRRAALRDVLARAAGPDSAANWATLGASPALTANPSIAGLLQQLTQLETEALRLATWRTPQDPDLRAIRQTTDALTQRLAAIAREQLGALDEQARSQDSVLRGLGSELESVPARELQYARLSRQVALVGELHTLLQRRLKEAQISEAVEVANIQLVDAAMLPRYPVKPQRSTTIAFAVLTGLFLGFLVALAREYFDTAIRSRDELLDLTNLPVLAVIPRQVFTNGLRRNRVAQLEAQLVTRLAPRSPAAEAYRALRTSIAFSALPRPRAMRTMVVTSAEPQDGKSTTAVNLAVTLAEQGMRVLLVEADQRRPVLHRVLRVERIPGLTDVLAGRLTLEDARHSIALPEHAAGSLDFLSGGTRAPNPAELAGSERMRALLADAAKAYDAVVIDTPPLSVVTDAAVTGTAADGVIFVARMGATNRERLRRAVEDLRGVGAPVIGAVLTDVRNGQEAYVYSYGYGRHYGADDE